LKKVSPSDDIIKIATSSS